MVRADSAPFGFGDPSLLVDGRTGRIFLFYVASHQQGFFGAGPGIDDADPKVLHAEYSWSDDDGRSWQHRRITAAIKDPGWGGLFASSGAGIQLQHGPHAGRLIQQYVVRVRGGNYGASAYSDDHGLTWRMGALVGPGVAEHKTVAVGRERPAHLAGERPKRLPAANMTIGQNCVGAACQHDVGAAQADLVCGG